MEDAAAERCGLSEKVFWESCARCPSELILHIRRWSDAIRAARLIKHRQIPLPSHGSFKKK